MDFNISFFSGKKVSLSCNVYNSPQKYLQENEASLHDRFMMTKFGLDFNRKIFTPTFGHLELYQLSYWHDLNKGRRVYTLSNFVYYIEILTHVGYLDQLLAACQFDFYRLLGASVNTLISYHDKITQSWVRVTNQSAKIN